MRSPLDLEEDAVALELAALMPQAMSPAELADAVELLARDRRHFDPVQAEMLHLAARRVRQLAGMRETLLYQLETIERLEQELKRLRVPGQQAA